MGPKDYCSSSGVPKGIIPKNAGYEGSEIPPSEFSCSSKQRSPDVHKVGVSIPTVSPSHPPSPEECQFRGRVFYTVRLHI